MEINFCELGERIRKVRKSKRLTQEALAEKVGLSVQHINNIENNRRKFSLETFIKISQALSISADYLLQDYINLGETSKIEFLEESLRDCSRKELELIEQVIDSTKKIIRKNKLVE